MDCERIVRMAAWLLGWVALCLASPALAQSKSVTFPSTCHSASDATLTIADMASETAQWICTDDDWQADRPTAWLRYDARAWQGQDLPRYFFSRIARFQHITIAAVDQDGAIRQVKWDESDGRAFGGGPMFQLDLPEVTPETQMILVRIDLPHSVPLLTEAELSPAPNASSWTQLDVIILAIVIGMLILPLLFDISFFIALREKFVLLHAIMVVAMMNYVVFGGGLIGNFVQFPVAFIAVAGALGWTLGVGVSTLFLVTFLEEGAQSRWMRRLTLATGVWTITVPGFFALQFHATQAFDDRGYFYAFLPVLMIITGAVIEALLRGSRDARFLAAAWTPIIVASAERLLRGLGVYTGPSTLDHLIFVATGLEVIIISLAVAFRFFDIRRQRDEAVTEARMLERLTERDPLTGLMNRRAIDARFVDLHQAGYETFALIDLDHFKSVNDTAGHTAGDAVLKVVASVLESDKNSIAMRLGGEEFLLLLRGRNAEDRAEKLRNAIPIRVAQEVPELELLVTASMGLLTIPLKAMPNAVFSDIYSRADMLLYEAKNQGRNRTNKERLRAFSRRKEDRRGIGYRAA